MKRFICLYLFVLGANCSFTESRIKLYTFFTESHRVLLDHYFLPSLKSINDDFDIEVIEFEQDGHESHYMGSGWNTMMLNKVHLILRAIEENWGSVFVYADVDIQFFRPFAKDVLTLLGDNDFVVQRNYPDDRGYCAGFFICRANEKTQQLWQKILDDMHANPRYDDQTPMSKNLKEGTIPGLLYAPLGLEFFNIGILTDRRWNPGEEFQIPANIILHHANWTVGMDNKIKQLEYVKALYKVQIS